MKNDKSYLVIVLESDKNIAFIVECRKGENIKPLIDLYPDAIAVHTCDNKQLAVTLAGKYNGRLINTNSFFKED